MDLRRDYLEGFRITRDGDSLVIEATDYHATPLRLSVEDLAEFGLRFGKPETRQQLSLFERESESEKDV
jgi:hypothetical protein